jgi:hypothetical protein
VVEHEIVTVIVCSCVVVTGVVLLFFLVFSNKITDNTV